MVISSGSMYIPTIGDKVYVIDIHRTDAFFHLRDHAKTKGILLVIAPPGLQRHLETWDEGPWWGIDATLLEPLDTLEAGDRITFYAAKFKVVGQPEPEELLTRWHFPLDLELP